MIEIPQKLIEEISSRKGKGALLIAIDGCGGAGKSTTATVLAPVHSNFEFERLKEQVLEPLRHHSAASYQTPEGKSLTVQPSGYVVVEGLGTLGKDLKDYFDYKIWVDSPEDIRRQRGIERDSKEWTRIWDYEYLPQDARYVREQAPQSVADWILQNN